MLGLSDGFSDHAVRMTSISLSGALPFTSDSEGRNVVVAPVVASVGPAFTLSIISAKMYKAYFKKHILISARLVRLFCDL